MHIIFGLIGSVCIIIESGSFLYGTAYICFLASMDFIGKK